RQNGAALVHLGDERQHVAVRWRDATRVGQHVVEVHPRVGGFDRLVAKRRRPFVGVVARMLAIEPGLEDGELVGLRCKAGERTERDDKMALLHTLSNLTIAVPKRNLDRSV